MTPNVRLERRSLTQWRRLMVVVSAQGRHREFHRRKAPATFGAAGHWAPISISISIGAVAGACAHLRHAVSVAVRVWNVSGSVVGDVP